MKTMARPLGALFVWLARHSIASFGGFANAMADIEDLARCALKSGLAIHRDLGPGLLESAYEALLAEALARQGLRVERQKPISLAYAGVKLDDAFKADLLVEGELLIELKSVEKLAPVHAKQVLTYLRLLNLPVGLLMNFGAMTFKECVRRILNPRADLSKLRMWRSKSEGDGTP
jgi:iron complex transport system substrate-binding protein